MLDQTDTNVHSMLAQGLIDQQLLNEQQAQELSQHCETSGESFIAKLYQDSNISPELLALQTSLAYGVPLYDLAVHDTTKIPEEFLELDIVTQQHGLPILAKHNALAVAIADPNVEALKELGFLTGLRIEFVIVTQQALTQMIERLTNNFDELEDVQFDELEDIEVSAYEEDNEDSVLSYDVDDTPVVRFVNKILIDAIRGKASDIHFEPYEKIYRVRYRRDGMLEEVANPPIKLSSSIVARLKVLANLDISERRVPQDGRFKLTLRRGQSVDFRMSTCPTLNGEKVVMRILDPSSSNTDLHSLGLEDDQLEHYLKAIHSPQGIVLVTGPTGSGKTVSLYSALQLINTPEKNISTIEDPVEIYMQGVNQVQVNNKAGMTFARALRAFLRQDPDVIMVGEIRDIETAEIAVKASQTGHLVFSTLHTNSVAETLIRLLSMGIESYNVASSVIMVMAQRLVRKLCPLCKTQIAVEPDVANYWGLSTDDIENHQYWGPVGCQQCHRGYKGRAGIFEVAPISSAISQIIAEGGNPIALAEQLKSEGIMSLREAGLLKVKAGITSFDEINRVTI